MGIAKNLNNHSHNTEHLQAEISRSLFSKNIRIDMQLRHSSHAKVSENREIVRTIIKVLILAARQNIALRGHNETISSQNQDKINERLLCLEAASDASGKGMFDTFCAIAEKYQINWKDKLCAQAYDGAASMQGAYSGLKTFIQNENPRAVYIWCFVHILNLAIVDTLDSSTDTRNFFGDLQELIGFMRARKRTAMFYEYQKKTKTKQKPKTE
ncbi:hypothetical protein ACI65C_013641 [Semiaphis heraclei]